MKRPALLAGPRAGGLVVALAVLSFVVAISFYGVFLPGQTLFSNDGPLGELMAQCHRLPARFAGCWLDLNNVGFNGAAAAPSISFGLQWLLGPIWFSKFYAVLSLLILGMGAWCFFRQSKLNPWACVLGALAVILNSTFFSVACWGVGAHDITAGMALLALAALADPEAPQRWLRVILAGLAVGMAVTEGADVGALYSLLVAAFIVYQSVMSAGPRVRNLAAGSGRLALVAVFALFLAAQSINGLVSTSIEGVVGTRQDAQTREARWNWATQWSLPRSEMLSLVVPGLFGYRTDTLEGGIYWGTMGRDPAWETYIQNGRQGPVPTGFLRYNGGGNYAGGLVVLLALWAAAQSFRRKSSVFDPTQRKWLWFWLAVAVVSLLLALGRFAPFYRFVYALPYFSTIRNPTKFLYFFSLAFAVLFAFGVDGLWRRHLAAPLPPGRWRLSSWWGRAAKFDRAWVGGCGLAGLGILLGWWAYAAHRDDLIQYLQSQQIGSSPDAVARFSIQQAGWLVVVFFLAAGLLVLIFSGAFAGRRAAVGGGLLALLLAGDLGLANQPWVRYWNYEDKYASNAVIDLLRDKPYEHRVAIAPVETTPALATLNRIYRFEWLQHEFPYYNIQSFETVEMPRMPEDYAAFVKEINDTNAPWFHVFRGWQLTAVRYVLAPSGFADYLAQQDGLGPAPLQLVTDIALQRKPGVTKVVRPDQVTAVVATNAPFAIFELTAPLPRARLVSRWEVNPNDAAVLATMFNPAFDPAGSVFVAGGVSPGPTGAPSPAGSVAISSYAPKDIRLQADATAPSILVLSDHFDPNWKVFVDGRPQELLRCDFLLRGVQVAPGTHQVEFKFQPPIGWLPVSLAALVVAVFALGVLAVWVRKNPAAVSGPAASASVPAARVQAGRPPQSARNGQGRAGKQ